VSGFTPRREERKGTPFHIFRNRLPIFTQRRKEREERKDISSACHEGNRSVSFMAFFDRRSLAKSMAFFTHTPD